MSGTEKASLVTSISLTPGPCYQTVCLGSYHFSLLLGRLYLFILKILKHKQGRKKDSMTACSSLKFNNYQLANVISSLTHTLHLSQVYILNYTEACGKTFKFPAKNSKLQFINGKIFIQQTIQQQLLLSSLSTVIYIKHKFYGARLSYRVIQISYCVWYRSSSLTELKNNSSASYMHNWNGNQSHHLPTYTNLKINETKEKVADGPFYHGNLEKRMTFKIYNQLNKMTKSTRIESFP